MNVDVASIESDFLTTSNVHIYFFRVTPFYAAMLFHSWREREASWGEDMRADTKVVCCHANVTKTFSKTFFYTLTLLDLSNTFFHCMPNVCMPYCMRFHFSFCPASFYRNMMQNPVRGGNASVKNNIHENKTTEVSEAEASYSTEKRNASDN